MKLTSSEAFPLDYSFKICLWLFFHIYSSRGNLRSLWQFSFSFFFFHHFIDLFILLVYSFIVKMAYFMLCVFLVFDGDFLEHQRWKKKKRKKISPSLCRLTLFWSPPLTLSQTFTEPKIYPRSKLKFFWGLFWACILPWECI